MSGIGIVGTGISGLQLALYLQAQGVDTTVYSTRSVEEHRVGRLPNCVMRWAPTVHRERALGAYHREDNVVGAVHVRVAAEHPLSFCGRLAEPANTTDFRLYLPDLLEDYQTRGGTLVVGACGPDDLDALGRRHDLVAVAGGRDGFDRVFLPDTARSPHETAPRHITAGLYHGIAWPEPAGVEFSIIPGLGEIFQVSFHSFDGPVSAVTVEGVPGGPLARLAQLDYEHDPHGFEVGLLEILQTHAPSLYERVDRSAFGLTRPLDLLQGRITPVVRRSWTPLDGGSYAIAIGDAWILNDPIAAQGANLGSRCAFVLGAQIVAAGPYHERFCRDAEDLLWQAAEVPTILSNALLEPPTEPILDLLVRASQDRATADQFAEGFGEPDRLLRMLAGEPAAV
jgi:2-polyprenyl-6-methoxyphenol hydroxylase-like FAD-dependent oxidoreductase